MNNIIKKIRKLFIDEASNSPLLFNDLANMEKYISESYSGRSLIELLQNSDDANSKIFFIELIDEFTYIIANDGRIFNDNDILALCRSGASTKTRNSNTIGFRGIGFKSIVNYANVVHLVSGDIKTTFSKQLTREILNNVNDVPLIRVPHEFCGYKFQDKINELLAMGYNTIFIFESKSNILEEEIKEFDSNYILFLQSIEHILLNIDYEKKYDITRKELDENIEIKVTSDKQINNWITTIPKDNKKYSVGFKFDGRKVIEARPEEAVVHSFMPTNDKLSMPIKINGDFSTDPSRTKIVLDHETKIGVKKCAKILVNLVLEILKSGIDEYGFINIFKRAQINPFSQIKGLDVNDILVEEFKKSIKIYLLKYADNKEIYLQLKGINTEDFNNIVKYLNICGINNTLQEKIPGLIECLKAFGLKEISIDKCLDALKEINCSENTRVTILVNIINKTRFGMDDQLKDKIRKSKLFTFNSGIKKLKNTKLYDLVDPNFENSILQLLVSSSDYVAFTKRIGLKQDQLAMNNKPKEILIEPKNLNLDNVNILKKVSFSKKKSIKKWRSVEKNVAAVLELLDDIDYVIDVSVQNMGYDLEAILKDGKKRYYEVKSVIDLGELISITNNEYSTASKYKNDYYLAIAKQSDLCIEICFIQNPINNLELSKRVTRWEWICDEYEGEVITIELSK